MHPFALALELAREARIDSITGHDLELGGRGLAQDDFAVVARHPRQLRQQRVTAAGGLHFGRQDSTRGFALELDGRRQGAGLRNHEFDIGALPVGSDPGVVVATAADRPYFAVDRVFDQVVHHTGHYAELEPEQNQHRRQHRGQRQDKTTRHAPFVGVVAETEAYDAR